MRVLGEDGRIVRREASFVPGLYKIFDEVLVNAADNFRRDPTGTTRIEVEIAPAEGRITIGNDGRCRNCPEVGGRLAILIATAVGSIRSPRTISKSFQIRI